MDWGEIYARLKRDREDSPALDALDQGVRAWARPELWARGWHVVDDVVADTCSAVVINVEAANGAETFAGFVLGYYRNRRRRALRERRRPEVPLPPDFEPPAPVPDTWPSEEDVQALRRHIEALPPREREAVRLRFFEERSSAEMAAALGVKEGNARRILSLGLARLRRGYLEASGAALPAPVPSGSHSGRSAAAGRTVG